MKILKFTVDGKCEEKEISGTLESLQAEVDGYIESVKLFSDEDITALVDEEGRLKGKPRNKCLKGIVGDFIIIGVKDDEFCDVLEKKVEALKNIFRPEEL